MTYNEFLGDYFFTLPKARAHFEYDSSFSLHRQYADSV